VLNYIYVGCIFGLAIFAFIFFKNRKPKKSSATRLVPAVEPKQSKSGIKLEVPAEPKDYIDKLVEVPARIYDNATRTIKNGMLSAKEVRNIREKYGNLGRRWYQDGDWRYAIVRLNDGTCKPVQHYMSASLKNPPERLHRALQQEETETFYKPRDNRSVLAKYGHYILFAGVVIVILFLWGANMMNG
jgi:hypothetical protein